MKGWAETRGTGRRLQLEADEEGGGRRTGRFKQKRATRLAQPIPFDFKDVRSIFWLDLVS